MQKFMTVLGLTGVLTLQAAWAVPLGSVDIEQDIGGTRIKFPITLDLSANTTPEGIRLDILADLNMKDLQQKLDGIVKSFPMPSDNCPGYGQHVLPTVESANLSGSGDQAVIDAKVNVVVWDCQQGVPLGGTTLRWETRCVNLGVGRVCTDVPVKLEPKPSPDIKNILVREGLVGTISLALTTPDKKGIELKPLGVNVVPRGDVGKFFDAIAGIFNSSLSDVAQREVQKAVDSGVLQQSLPKEIQAYNPSVENVQFRTDNDGTLYASTKFTALLTGDQMGELIRK